MIIGISPDRLSSVWHQIEPLLKKAFAAVDYPLTLLDVIDAVQKSEMQLWMTHDAKMAWMTQIIVYPRYKVFLIISGGGEGIEDWLQEADSLFTAFASHHGCKYVEIQGRRGWVRVGEPLGYTPIYTTIRKEVA